MRNLKDVKGAFKKNNEIKYLIGNDIKVAKGISEVKQFVDCAMDNIFDPLDILAFVYYVTFDWNVPITFSSGELYEIALSEYSQDELLEGLRKFVNSYQFTRSIDKILVSYPYVCVEPDAIFNIEDRDGNNVIAKVTPITPTVEGVVVADDIMDTSTILDYMKRYNINYLRTDGIGSAVIRSGDKLRFIDGMYGEDAIPKESGFECVTIKGKRRQQLVSIYNVKTGYNVGVALTECFSPKVKMEYVKEYTISKKELKSYDR